MTPAREALKNRLIASARADPRFVGVLDYGSSSERRADDWSDLDIALFIRDADYADFMATWRDWVAGLGDLLLAYVGAVGHPWTVYDAEPVPLRVDFDVLAASRLDEIAAWPNAPASVEAMLWYDATGGALADRVRRIVGRSLEPADLAAAFASVSGDFWYYLVFVECKLRRGEHWSARQAFHGHVMENLCRLLRLEADATDRWSASAAAARLERTLSFERLTRLEECVPGRGTSDLRRAMLAAAWLGTDVCAGLGERHGWAWPSRLAERVVQLLGETAIQT